MREHDQGIRQKLVIFATSCGMKNISMKQWLQKFIYIYVRKYIQRYYWVTFCILYGI